MGHHGQHKGVIYKGVNTALCSLLKLSLLTPSNVPYTSLHRDGSWTGRNCTRLTNRDRPFGHRPRFPSHMRPGGSKLAKFNDKRQTVYMLIYLFDTNQVMYTDLGISNSPGMLFTAPYACVRARPMPKWRFPDLKIHTLRLLSDKSSIN